MSLLRFSGTAGAGRARLIGRLTSLALAVAALAGAPAVAQAQTARLRGPQCARPTGLSVRAPQGADDEAADSFILGKLEDGAFDYAKSEGLGYALKLLGHEQKTVDPAEIDRQFDSVNSRLDSLARQQYEDCSAVLDAINAVKLEVDSTAYATRAADLDATLADLADDEIAYAHILQTLRGNGGRLSGLSDDELSAMQQMMSKDGLLGIVSAIDKVQSEAAPGKPALVETWGTLVAHELGYDPYASHIFPAEFLDAGQAQIDYYTTLLTHAAYLYASVGHLDFTYGSYTHHASGGDVNDFVDLVRADIHRWSVDFDDGPGSDQWVSQGKGWSFDAIPQHTLIDDTGRTHPTLWTEDGAGLDDTPPAPDLSFCATTAPFCFADRYLAGPVASALYTDVADAALVTPSPSSLTELVGEYIDDGVDGWHVPSADDWKALEAGASASTESLWDWAKDRGIAPLEADPAVYHHHGQDVTRTAIRPVWENAGTADKPDFRILTAMQRTDQTAQPQALSEVTTGVSGGDTGVAARAVLTRDWQFAPAPLSGGGLQGQPTPRKHRHHHASAPVLSGETFARSARHRFGDLAAKTFGDAHACGTAPQDTYVVPDGAGSVRIEAKGGAGGGKTGGRGGTATVVVPARAGETLYVQVGGAAHGVTGGTGGGGNGGNTSASEQGAGGGGASGVSTTATCDHWLVVAGGGGGTGGMPGGGPGGDGGAVTQSGLAGAAAGSGGASAGSAGSRSPNNIGGGGGQYQALTKKANAHSGANGDLLQGGTGGQGDVNTGHTYNGDGGGGGAGYWGGGGGGGQGAGAPGGGGAGGESYVVAGARDRSFGQNDGGAGGSVTITPIAKVQPPHTLTVSASDLGYGQPLTLTATVPVDETGGVGFYDSNGAVAQGLGVAALHHGSATITLNTDDSRLHQGENQITFSTGGDAQYLANDSAPVAVTISPKAPPVTLSVNGTDPVGYQPTSITARVPTGVTGTIMFHDDVLGDLGTATIDNGYATLPSIPAMLDGVHNITAHYNGDAQYLPATSATVTVTISNVSEYAFAKAGAPTTQLLEVPGDVRTPGTAVDTYEAVPNPSDPAHNELWLTAGAHTVITNPKLASSAATQTQLVNRSSAFCLTADATAGHIVQRPCDPASADQQWLLTPTVGGMLIQIVQDGGSAWPAGTDDLATTVPSASVGNDTPVTLAGQADDATLWTATAIPTGA